MAELQQYPVGPIVPAADPVSEGFWAAARDHRLAVQQCTSCHRRQHPPEPICAACLSPGLQFTDVSGTATVYSYSVATQAFHPWFADKLPYVLVVVELDEQPGLRLVSNLVDADLTSLHVGQRVQVAFREIPGGMLPIFRPASAAVGEAA